MFSCLRLYFYLMVRRYFHFVFVGLLLKFLSIPDILAFFVSALVVHQEFDFFQTFSLSL